MKPSWSLTVDKLPMMRAKSGEVECHDFHWFSTFFFLSPKRPLIQLCSTMTCSHIPYLILSHVPFPLSYLLSSFGHFGQKVNSVISDCLG